MGNPKQLTFYSGFRFHYNVAFLLPNLLFAYTMLNGMTQVLISVVDPHTES